MEAMDVLELSRNPSDIREFCLKYQTPSTVGL